MSDDVAVGKYHFKGFTEDSLSRTEQAWEDDLANAPEYFPGDVSRHIEFAKRHSDYENKTPKSHAYGIFEKDSEIAESIVNIIISRAGRNLVKMLSCDVRPRLVEKTQQSDLAAIEEMARIYSTAIIGAIKLTGANKARETRLYGRTEQLLLVLKLVAKHISEQENNGITATIKGRWLVLEPARKKRQT